MKKALSLILALVMVATMFAVITVPASAAVEPKVNTSVYDVTVDKSWYNAEAPQTEYTLYTAAQLAGLADLVNTDGVKFDGVTIKLGADIIWNEGTFTLDADNKTALYNGTVVSSQNSVNVWPVIGTRPEGSNYITAGENMFHGNFDGQGHVVSGLYVNTTGAYASFFSVFCGEFIKNLSIVNSYFGCDFRNGSFAGHVTNNDTKDVTFENLYTDAHIVIANGNNNARSGGIFGMMRYSNSLTVKNVWFDGSINAFGDSEYYGTPYVGGIAGFITPDTTGGLKETIEFDSCLVTGIINVQFGFYHTSEELLTKRGIGGIVGSLHTSLSTDLKEPVDVNLKNCLVAVDSTNMMKSEDMRSLGAFIPRFETCWVTYTVENSYFVPMGIFCTSNTMSHVDGSIASGVTFNGTLIAEKHTIPTEETVPTAKIEKISDATGLSDDVFDLTGDTASLKNIRTKISESSLWDGTVDTSWFDPANPKSEYVLVSASQLAGLAKLVDDAVASSKPFHGITIKLGTNIVLNDGIFTVAYDNKTPLYNGKIIDQNNPVNEWDPIGDSGETYSDSNSVDVMEYSSFWGNFDGCGYTVSGMYINLPENRCLGLFSMFSGYELKNFNITNSFISCRSRSGSVAGFVTTATTAGDASTGHDVSIENIYSDAYIVTTPEYLSDGRSGGIFGMFRHNQNVSVTNADFAGMISGFSMNSRESVRAFGGIAGVICGELENKTYTFTDCDVTGSIYLYNANNSVNSTSTRVGGFIGISYKTSGVFNNCSAEIKDTNITADNGFITQFLGAFIGYYENYGNYTYTDCSFVQIGLFLKGLDNVTGFNLPDNCTINGKTGTEWATSTDDIAIIQHKYGEWNEKIDPSFTQEGTLGHYQCSNCKKYFDIDDNEITSDLVISKLPTVGNIEKISTEGNVVTYKITYTDGTTEIIAFENGEDGKDGVDGKTPYIKDGNWWIGDTDTGVKAEGVDGEDGKDGTNGKDGVDGEDGKDGKDGVDGKTPSFKIENGQLWVSYDNGEFWKSLGSITSEGGQGVQGSAGADGKDGVDGEDGKDGLTPYIGQNGNWWIGETDTGVKAAGTDGKDGENGADGKDGINGEDGKDGADGKDGVDGLTPYIGSNGNWWIGETDTGIKAAGKDGQNGADGKDGVNGKDGNGIANITTQKIGGITTVIITFTDSSVPPVVFTINDGADGKDGVNGENGKDGVDGLTPFIGQNGNWWIGNTDTGVKAAGTDGKDGVNGENGKDGVDGLTPFIGQNGNWWIGDTDTGVKAAGVDGTNGKDGENGKDGTNGKDGNGIASITPSEINGVKVLIFTFTDPEMEPVVVPVEDLITNTKLNPDNTDIEVNTNDNDNGNDNSSKSCAGFSALAYLFALIATSAAVIVFKKKN